MQQLSVRAQSIDVDTPLTNLAYSQNPVYLGVSHQLSADLPIISGGQATSFQVSPHLPTGISLDAHTGVISGKAVQTIQLQQYLVTARNTTSSVSGYVALGVFPQPPPLLHPLQAYAGNSFPGVGETDNANHTFVQNDLEALYTLPDGKVFTNSYYDEGGNSASVFLHHHFVFSLQHLHGWNRLGGQAVVSDGKYVFAAMIQNGGIVRKGMPPSKCGTYYSVSRYDMQGNPAPFVRLTDPSYHDENGGDGAAITISRDIQYPNISTPSQGQCDHLITDGGALLERGAQVTGLALYGGKLFVSDFRHGIVRVYDEFSMQELHGQNFPMQALSPWMHEKPWQLAIQNTTNILWIVQRPDGNSSHGWIVPYTLGSAGAKADLKRAIIDVGDPSALAVDPSGRYLLVTDDALSHQNVAIYDLQTRTKPLRVNTIGMGGPFSKNTSNYGNALATSFNRPVGVGVDAAGHIYVATNGHGLNRYPMVGSDSDTRTTAGMFASIREFQPHAGLGLRDPQPTLTYEYQDWTFIDNFAFDGNNVYSKYQRFSTDDTLNSSHQYQMHHLGYTLDPQRYSDDPRIHNERDGIWVERVQGQSFLYMSSQFASTGLAIYRLQGNVAVPAGYMQLDPSVNNWPGGISHSGWWSWTDDNADGQMQRSEIETQILPGLASGSWAWNTDSHGDIWVVPEIPDRTSHHFTVYHFPLERIDTKGVPHYARIDHADLDRSLSDSQFGRIERFIYQASNDAAFISGFRPTDSAFNRGWGAVGTTLCRYDHWSNPEKRALRWSVNLPFSLSLPRVFDAQNASATFPKVLTLAGKKLFIVYSSPAWIQVIDADTGALTSQPIQAEKRFGGSMMLTDMPYGATASVRPNGNTVLSVEEDDRGKNMIYVFTKGML